MALTYHDLLRADLSALSEAAGKWKAMGNRFDTLRQHYLDNVKVALRKGNWVGQGADAYQDTSGHTLHEFTAARNQARAIGKLLEDAHGVLTGWKRKVEAARDEAVEAKMKVDQDGVCSYDFSRFTDEETQAITRDRKAREETERSWTQHIAGVVKKAAHADHEIKLALKAAATDTDPQGGLSGFNGKAVGSLKEFHKQREAAEAKKKAEKKKSEGEVKVSISALRGVARGVEAFGKTNGSFPSRLISGVVEGVSEATGYNQTQGVCLNASAGMVVGAGGEACLVQTQKPDGGKQIAMTTSGSGQSAGMNFGYGGGIGVLKSNADDWSQLKGNAADKGASLRVGPYGGFLNNSQAIGTTNSKGEDVQNFTGGMGMGLSTEIGGGGTKTTGVKLWEGQ
ncbi:hypothetical protein [Streptomyces sp. ODS28]|uniref:hypothetical protein n=1 Tax=Streptomyces sp. ODS28 TaxID=3136688 RepID=UPI0031EC0176